jgi:hypothetical protein
VFQAPAFGEDREAAVISDPGFPLRSAYKPILTVRASLWAAMYTTIADADPEWELLTGNACASPAPF